MLHSRQTSVWLKGVICAVAGTCTLVGIAACSPGSKVPSDVSTANGCTVAPTTFSTWFKTGAVTLNGEVTPANSLTFPNQPNCSFYEWSEQMFLWLTSPTPPNYGGGGGLIFASPAFFDVSPRDANGVRTLIPHKIALHPKPQLRTSPLGAHGSPVLRDKAHRFIEVVPTPVSRGGRQMIRNQAGQLVEIGRATLDASGKPQFFDMIGKAIALPLRPAELQAGATPDIITVQKIMVGQKPIFVDPFGGVVELEQGQSGGEVLMAQNGSLVYYIITVNDVFAYFASGMNSTPPQISAIRFPINATDLQQVTKIASGVTFPDPEALAIELKSSWVEATNLPAGCTYITMKATIPTYDKTDPAHWFVNGETTTTLAMTGMHVVGSTLGHEEMLWATFEHVCNAPHAGYTYTSTNGNKPGPAENGPWLFSASNSPNPFNVWRMSYNASANPATIDANTSASNPYPHVVGPSDTLRAFPWGMLGTSVFSNTQVIAMNNSVRGQLASGDVRGNYIMTGTTWTAGGGLSAPQVGTNKLAATTMETYVQGTNCFSCHNGANPGSGGQGLSHIFGELKPLGQ